MEQSITTPNQPEISPSSEGEVSLGLPESVCIGIPCYSETIPLEQATALVEAVHTLRMKGIKVAIATERGNALIDLARNRIVTKFLRQTDYKKLFWLDDDIIFKPDDMERLLAWSTLYPVVGATYPVRQDPPKFFIRRESEVWDQNEYGLFKIVGTGLGFCVIDRSVFDKMEPTIDKFQVEDEQVEAYYTIERKDGVYYGEDITFFRKWHDELGGCFMLDPAIHLKHVGSKAYDYNLVDYLRGIYKGKLNG